MVELSPEEIVRARNSSVGFRKLYDHYSPVLWRIILRTVDNDRVLAEDILQDLFVSVHRSLHKFKGESALSTWLYQIAWRMAVKARLRRSKRKSREISVEFDLAYHPEDFEQTVELVLNSLSEEERFLLVSREIDGFQFEELAVITGQSSGALRTAVSRLKEKIRTQWKGELYE